MAHGRAMPHDSSSWSAEAQTERLALGFRAETPVAPGSLSHRHSKREVPKRALVVPSVLNEAPSYPRPSSFSRGLIVDVPGARQVVLSGTASIGPRGETLYPGDFDAQCWRTYRNLTALLASASVSWHDVVRCTCYLRDIERDYAAFNEIRTELFTALGLDPLPASTAIQARLCRSDLLVEIELLAIAAA